MKPWWRVGRRGGACRAGHARRALPARALAAFGLALVILTSQALRAPRATSAAPPARHVAALVGVRGFVGAGTPWRFSFPRDHAAHDLFASEWWYFTGHVRSASGRRFGFELTFFRVGLAPGPTRVAAGQSAWRGDEVYPAHFAISDVDGGRFVHYERFAREALGAGFASTSRLDVRDDGWTLSGPAPFRLHAAADGDGIDFSLVGEKAPAVHGHDGISRKGACATCASHYYSITRMATRGALTYRGERLAVDGISWMDHEFGSDELQGDLVGWDWVSLQLDDRRELMLYLLRRKDGSVVPESSGSVIDARGGVTYLPRAAFALTATGSWTSPHTGGVYPSGWRVRVPSARIDVTLTPQLLDQELANTTGGVSYWEGAVDARDATTGRAVGLGYVELTGYTGSVSL